MLASAKGRGGRWAVCPGGPARPRTCTPEAESLFFLSDKNEKPHSSSTSLYYE